jgi:hypothetical protein
VYSLVGRQIFPSGMGIGYGDIVIHIVGHRKRDSDIIEVIEKKIEIEKQKNVWVIVWVSRS